ncbi:MAG: hypothetical protein LBQ57_03880 [Spirochaetales bacterium]|nr:hypothetical protein [Spirochaetales bacterium]
MKNLPRAVLLACILLNCGANVFAQTDAGLVTEISISGLERTRDHVARYHLKKFIGREAAGLDFDEVKAAVLDTGMLEPLSVELEAKPGGEGYILKVTVEEKWAIIPLPMFNYSSDSLTAGGIIVDTNAFGLGDTFAIGGTYMTEGWNVLALYEHKPSQDYVPGWEFGGLYSREERRDTNQKDEDIRRFKLDAIIASFGLSYALSDNLTASIAFLFQQGTLLDSGDPLLAPADDARAMGLSPALSWEESSWDGYLLSRRNATLKYDWTAGIDFPSFYAVSLEAIYEKSLIPGFRLNLQSGIVYSPNATVFFEKDPSAALVDILPDTFAARSYAGLSLGLEKYLYRFSWGTLSLLTAYQAVWSEGSILGEELDQGAAGFLRLYLSKIALPALGIGMAYNVSSGYRRMVISLGISF